MLGIGCGMLWRLELEWHGWKGLNWLYYFHYSIPVVFLCCIVWVNVLTEFSSFGKRVALNSIAVLLSIAIYISVKTSIVYYFTSWGIFAEISTPFWKLNFLRFSVFLMLLWPLLLFILLKILKLDKGKQSLFWSMIVMLFSVPVSIFVLQILNHKGQSDFIHTIKSGVLLPFLVFSVGVLFIDRKKQE